MESKCDLLLYLDKRRYLTDMKTNCDKFIEQQLAEKTMNKFPPFRHLLEIDVMDVLDKSPDLGELLLKEPLKWQRMCGEILYACLQSTMDESGHNIHVQPAQVVVTLRFKCIPRALVQPNLRYYAGLVSIDGVLIAVSKPTSYVYHTVWSCPEECDGSEVISHYIPKAPPKCDVCRSVLFENSGLRRCGEQVIATFKLDNGSKKFKIVDDLIPRLALGSRYSLHAVVVKILIAVWSLEEIIPLAAPMTCALPKDVKELYQACSGQPWLFVYCLASSIGVNVCPLNCFMHVKISLLMSLASVKANMLNGSGIVHVLAAGYDTRYVGDLMNEAAKLADRSVFLGTSNNEVSTSLLASSGGVCFMPLPLHTYNQKQTSAILSAIESKEVVTDSGKGKLLSAIWVQGADFKKLVLFNVASVFGAVCRGDYGEYNDEIVDFILQRVVEPGETSEEEIRALGDVALHIDLVAGIKVALDDSAECLLRNYFLAARKERTRGVSVGSMGALVTSCLTSARLCRRLVASVDDAVFAIWLHISGSGEPRFAPDEFLQTPADVKKLEKVMNKFKDWLSHWL